MTDYEFYIKEYKGNTIKNRDAFDSVAVEAEIYVEGFILAANAGELLENPVVNRKYSLAVCSVADIIFNQNKTSSNKTSESVGNHSVSYSIKTPAEREAEKRNKVMTFLRGTGLLYGGLS